jgi:ParB/RepB/Spo0J family partition protein
VVNDQILHVNSIVPDPNQPRKTFKPESIQQLSASIKKEGLLQPIAVRPNGDGYIIIAGERRWRACRLAGLTEIPARIHSELSELTVRRLALLENVVREDLNPIETAIGIKGLLDSDYDLQDIAETLGYAPETIERKLSLNSLEAKLQKHVASGQIPESVALLLTKLSSEGQYLALRKIRNKPYSQAKPIIDAILEQEHQVDLFAPAYLDMGSVTRQQKSLVRRYNMAMLATIAFVKAITGNDYRILANGLDDGRLGKRIAEIDLAIKGLRRIKGELETYQQSKKLRRAA